MIVEPTPDIAEYMPAQPLFDERELAISVRNVGKMYRIYEKPQDRLKQMLLWRFGKNYGHEFWAVRNVSFDVRRGETIGIVGRNGSGKSTLLQMIAGTLAPTEGDIQVHGRVAALLELGSGFNPEFTGRENVFLNGTILGLSREEMAARFDEIAAFADIGEFIEQPVKMYSSGMFMRLAFAVQACTDPEILIVDEALAVGDVFFSQKCYRRLDELRKRGTAILIVTHNMTDIRQYCKYAIVLDHGQAVFQGPSTDAIAQYLLRQQAGDVTLKKNLPTVAMDQAHQGTHSLVWPTDPNVFLDIAHVPVVTNGWARCTSVGLCNADGHGTQIFEQYEQAQIFYEFELLHDIDVPIGGFNIENLRSVHVHGKNTMQYDQEPVLAVASRGMRIRFSHTIALDIAPGEYTFEIGLATIPYEIFQQRYSLTPGDAYSHTIRICHLNPAGTLTVVPKQIDNIPQHVFFGLANLPGEHGASYVGASAQSSDSADEPTPSGVSS
jgi:lipopolysaccharide transport system ATP-binding protein